MSSLVGRRRRRPDCTAMPFMSGIDVGNDTRPVPPRLVLEKSFDPVNGHQCHSYICARSSTRAQEFENPTLQHAKHSCLIAYMWCNLCKPFSLPIVAALDLHVHDSNKPVFLLSSPSHSWPILVALSSNLGKPNPFQSHRTLSLPRYAIRPLPEAILINQREADPRVIARSYSQ